MDNLPPIQSITLSHLNNKISCSFQKRKRMDTLNQRRFLSFDIQVKDDFSFMESKDEFNSFNEVNNDFNSHMKTKDDFKIDPLIIIQKIREIIIIPLPNLKKHREIKKLLQLCRDVIMDNLMKNCILLNNNKIMNEYLDLLGEMLKEMKENISDLAFEVVFSFSAVSCFDIYVGNHMIGLIVFLENQMKNTNIYNANILIEKTISAMGNFLCEKGHCEVAFKNGLPKIVLKLMGRNDPFLLNGLFWMISNFIRSCDCYEMIECFTMVEFQKTYLNILNKYENNNLVIAELIWMMAVLSQICSDNINQAFFETSLLNRLIAILGNKNAQIKIIIPILTIFSNIAPILGNNCFLLIQNEVIQSLIEKGLNSNIYALKREVIFLLSNLVLNKNTGLFICKYNNFVNLLVDLFEEILHSGYLDNVFFDLGYLFCNLVTISSEELKENRNFLKLRGYFEKLLNFEKEEVQKLARVFLNNFKL